MFITQEHRPAAAFDLEATRSGWNSGSWRQTDESTHAEMKNITSSIAVRVRQGAESKMPYCPAHEETTYLHKQNWVKTRMSDMCSTIYKNVNIHTDLMYFSTRDRQLHRYLPSVLSSQLACNNWGMLKWFASSQSEIVAEKGQEGLLTWL